MTTADLVASALFGDGAAAVVAAGEQAGRKAPARLPQVIATRSEVYPDSTDTLGWRLGADGFRIVLTAELAEVVERRLNGSVTAFLGEHGLTVDDIGSWICHPGGPKVLDAAQRALKLPDSAMAASRRSLAEAGNMSSASVLHILELTADGERPPPGTFGLMIGLGPGRERRTAAAEVVSLVTVYWMLLAVIACERVAELVVSARHANALLRRGGVEYGFGHFPVMIALHVALLAGCVLEPLLGHRTFIPALGWPMLAVTVAANALRWWCIATLGERWTARVIVLPGAPLVRSGPYRWFAHPNYVAVIVEGAALPLTGSAWITACAFTLLNAALLTVRIRCETRALATAAPRAVTPAAP